MQYPKTKNPKKQSVSKVKKRNTTQNQFTKTKIFNIRKRIFFSINQPQTIE